MKNTLTLSVLSLLFVGVFFPAYTHAATIVSQTVSTTSTAYYQLNGSTQYIGQSLGTGLSGTITGADIIFQTGSYEPTALWYLYVYQCDNNTEAWFACTNSSQVASDIFSQSASSSSLYQFRFDTPFTLNSSKYYFLTLTTVTTHPTTSLFGSSGNTYSNGRCIYYDSGSYTPCTSALDWYFIVQGAVGYSTSTSNGIKSLISPYSGQVTTTNTPTFSFTYYYDSAQGYYNKVGFSLIDNTSGQNIDTSSASSTISASGLSTYAQPFGLTSGHIYTWRPYMYDTTGTSTRLYGPSTSFTAVIAQSLYVSQGNTYQSTTTPAWSPNWYATTSTSTISIPLSTAMGTSSPWGDILQHKFPFSYFYDLGVIFDELETGTTTSGVISFVTPSLFGTQPTTTPIVIANFNNLPNKAILDSVRTYIQYALWIMFAIYAPTMILKHL